MKKIFKFLFEEHSVILLIVLGILLLVYHTPFLFILYFVVALMCVFPDLIKKGIWAVQNDYWYQSLREDFINLFKKNGR